jgi:CRISPR-associated protein Cas2
MALTVVAAYDIQSDSRRARVAARLQQWGDRIQYSVFICSIEHESLDELVKEIEDIINPTVDSFIVFRQCATCWDSMIIRGQAEPRPQTLYWAAL